MFDFKAPVIYGMDPERKNSVSMRDRSATSSLKRGEPLIIYDGTTSQSDDDIENDCVSQAGDIGDRALQSSRYDGNISLAPLSQGEGIHPHMEETEVIVLSRYLLDKLFGPEMVGLTSADTILYPDLPSNMLGSFLMGWFGSVFKGDLVKVSDNLAIGLTTGFLGSLTTFSGWNQKMVELASNGHWLFALLGFFFGLFLVAYAIIFGVETGKGIKWVWRRVKHEGCGGFGQAVHRKRGLAIGCLMVVMLGCLWGLSAALEAREFGKRPGGGGRLWLACLVGPTGVWIRWFAARLNGSGLRGSDSLRWVPFGTLLVNVSAAALMAALATLKKSVTEGGHVEVVASGLQFGFLGCLSTVSTFMAEFDAMRSSRYPWRAYTYAVATIVPSFTLGLLIYALPLGFKGYN